jgi:heavy metal sensor kinase
MNLPLRARLTAWYFGVLLVSFASLAWISDYGFRRSIETTVNDASRANLESIQRVLLATAPKGMDEVKDELDELAGLWAGGALLEVVDAQGKMVFQSPPFQHPYPYNALPPAEGAAVHFFTTNLDDVQYRIAMRTIEAAGQKFYVRAAVSTEPLDQALDRFRLILKLTLPLLVVLASLGGYWLSRRALAPVDEIIRTARGIGVQNLSGRLSVPGPQDELRRLTETLNDMLARIEASFKRITQFTADASHDLRTPVALIRTSAELALRRSRTEEEYREALSRILGTSEETTHLIENLLTLARADAGASGLELRRVDLLPPLKKAAEQASVLATAKGIQISNGHEEHPTWILADSAALERLFLLVLENAVKYTPEGGRIEIQVRNGQGTANVDIRDTGIGISEKDLPHIFERFYRADQARSREPGGSGLGLAIALWIVEMHGGAIQAQSAAGSGSIFHISLPVSPNA